MGVNCNYIISNGLKTNKWWGEEKNKFWMRVHRNCYNWNGWKQTNGEEWKNLFRFFFSHPILYTSILKNNASKREDDESMVDSLPVSWRLYIFKGFFLLWIIRWLSTSKMPALWEKCKSCIKTMKKWNSSWAKTGHILPINAFTKALQVCGLHWLACATYKWGLNWRSLHDYVKSW